MINRDSYGAVGHLYPGIGIEGGDSASWTGHLVFFTDEDFDFDFFEVAWGGYVRHPIYHPVLNRGGSYYKDAWNANMSRDQLTGVIGARIRKKDYGALLRIIGHSALRGFIFAYNTVQNGLIPEEAPWKVPDLMLFDMWATILRGFGKASYLLHNLFVLLDLQMLLATIFFTNRSEKDDQINYAMKLLISREFVPTPTSWISQKILNRDRIISNINRYWGPWRRNEGMRIFYQKAIGELR